MVTISSQCATTAQEQPLHDEIAWDDLYRSLSHYMRKHMYGAGIQSWHGQEADLVEDIVQEAISRTFIYLQKVQHGESSSIVNVFHFSRTIAYHYYQDLRRRERRLIRPSYEKTFELEIDTIEMLLEELTNEETVIRAVQIIIAFPPKQQKALLIDLANRSEPGETSILELALLRAGIHLSDYRGALPTDPTGRSRHAASLSIAYQRLKRGYRSVSNDHTCKN